MLVDCMANINWGRWSEFDLETMSIESGCLSQAPWGTPAQRRHLLVVPKGPTPRKGFPVVTILSGFTGNATYSVAPQFLEQNLLDQLDLALQKRSAPRAIYVLVDAITPWGGGQYINSRGQGRWHDHLAGELAPGLKSSMPVRGDSSFWCVMGGSSGGYGALSLASQSPEIWAVVAALAPDSAFELSLYPDILSALPRLQKTGGIEALFTELKSARLNLKQAHSLLNAVAMGLCYAPDTKGRDVLWPIDSSSGRLDPSRWNLWSAHDPVRFLPRRRRNLRKWKAAYLGAPTFDQFHLQYGTRRIRDILRSQGIKHVYREFEGNHFDLGSRRPDVWLWLTKLWRA